MTDSAIIAASYNAEKSYTHNLDNVIDPSDAVGAWGTAKESTTELSDLSGHNNIATIKGPMPTEGFIQGRRFDGIDDYVSFGNDNTILGANPKTLSVLVKPSLVDANFHVIYKEGTYASTNMFQIGLFSSNKYFISQHGSLIEGNIAQVDVWVHLRVVYNGTTYIMYENGIQTGSGNMTTNVIAGVNYIGRDDSGNYWSGSIAFVHMSMKENPPFFSTLARLPFWSVNYTDYPNNVTEYTDNLPYSSSIISSGTFKVDDDKLQCVSAGTITYRASYAFDGSEYIKITIDGVVYAGTGTITQGNTTVSVAQGSNKITIQAGTGDTIDKVDIQFREEV